MWGQQPPEEGSRWMGTPTQPGAEGWAGQSRGGRLSRGWRGWGELALELIVGHHCWVGNWGPGLQGSPAADGSGSPLPGGVTDSCVAEVLTGSPVWEIPGSGASSSCLPQPALLASPGLPTPSHVASASPVGLASGTAPPPPASHACFSPCLGAPAPGLGLVAEVGRGQN